MRLQNNTGYSPGHPWYYHKQGKILTPDEIKPRILPSVNNFFIDPVKDEKKYLKKLKQEKVKKKKELQRDVDRYKQIISGGVENFTNYAWNDKDDPMPYYQALSLKHNHILYNKSKLAYIDREISRLEAGPGYQFNIFNP